MPVLLTIEKISKSHIFTAMMTFQITGAQLKAARVFAGLSQQQVAARAGVHRETLRAWERSSHAVPHANAHYLARTVAILEAEGVGFRADGVFLCRGEPTATTVIHSEAHA
jgi:transcriptional regulator with XRE-family HTH domain